MAHIEVAIDQLHHEIQEIKSLLQQQADTNPLRAPKTIFVDSLRSDLYRLSHAIPVAVEYEEDTVIASFHDLDLYGLGDEVSEAIDDLYPRTDPRYKCPLDSATHPSVRW